MASYLPVMGLSERVRVAWFFDTDRLSGMTSLLDPRPMDVTPGHRNCVTSSLSVTRATIFDEVENLVAHVHRLSVFRSSAARF